MRRILVIIGFLTFCCFTANAQKALPCYSFKENQTGNEFAFSIYSLRELPSSVYRYSKSHNRFLTRGFHQSIANGLMYKYHWNNHAFRIGGSYLTASDNSKEEKNGVLMEHAGIYHGVDMRMGYQLNLLQFGKEWQLFAALDGYYLMGTMRGNLRDTESDNNTNNNHVFEHRYWERSREYGTAMTFGAYYKVGPSFSVSAELTGNYSYVILRDDLKLTHRESVFRFHPIRMLSLNYHF